MVKDNFTECSYPDFNFSLTKGYAVFSTIKMWVK